MAIEVKSFTAFEYHKDTQFYPADFRYQGSTETAWDIFRNDEHYLSLPSGYVLLKTLVCGICSTDIARHNLPFPLPQITGHEVVALHGGKKVVVDINASHKHRGAGDKCEYCDNGLENHCPDRLTLGIDRLPGGFAPYILVPKNAIIPLPENFSLKLACVVEPFSAALHAVETENIQDGDRVAIVGPRRLGGLLILALKLWREKTKTNFTITAIIRNEQVRDLCELAGADEVVLSAGKAGDISRDIFGNSSGNNLENRKYDIVFDTSGSVSGFELALSLAKRSVHVKSTNGKIVGELKYLTEMVIDELNLLPLSRFDLKNIKSIACDASLQEEVLDELKEQDSEVSILTSASFKDYHRRVFDVVIGASFDFINNAIKNENGIAAIKPKGMLVLSERNSSSGLISSAIANGIKISTSRCGDFKVAIEVLQENMESSQQFINSFVSDVYEVEELKEAFEKARSDKQAVKVLVEHR